jgi:hypothetical protein
MKENSKILAAGLKKAAFNLREGAYYAWGHHGACNCGHLLQVVTDLSKEEILTYAHTGRGEWTELAEESCSVTGAPFDLLIKKLQDLGLTPTDIHNLEYLEDREVLNRLPGGFRWLKKNLREDVIVYFETLAEIIESKITAAETKEDELPAQPDLQRSPIAEALQQHRVIEEDTSDELEYNGTDVLVEKRRSYNPIKVITQNITNPGKYTSEKNRPAVADPI